MDKNPNKTAFFFISCLRSVEGGKGENFSFIYLLIFNFIFFYHYSYSYTHKKKTFQKTIIP